METQGDKILARIKEVGYVDRNWALANYISRLAAIVPILEEQKGSKLLHLKGDELQGGKEGNYYYVAPKRVERVGGKYKII